MLYVFTKNGCGTCKSVISQLKQKSVNFKEIDVGTTEGWEKAKSLGISAAGTIIDENNNIIKLSDIK